MLYDPQTPVKYRDTLREVKEFLSHKETPIWLDWEWNGYRAAIHIWNDDSLSFAIHNKEKTDAVYIPLSNILKELAYSLSKTRV
jgi:hypothetical protein